jgi:uncharacterized membrane protein
MLRRLALALATAALVGAAFYAGLATVLALAVATLGLIVVPGYLLTTWLHPDEMTGVEAAGLTAGLGLTVLLLGGLLLSALPLGIHPIGLVALLVAVLFLVGPRSLRAAWDRMGAAAAGVADSVNRTQVLALVVAVSAMLLAFGQARVSDDLLHADAITQLWAVPVDATEEAARESVVAVGVRNAEGQDERYRIRVTRGDQLIAEWEDVPLADGEMWSRLVAAAAGPEEPLSVELFRGDEATPIRSVAVVLPADEAVNE